jgi:RNA polymerase sigma-70 factor (ECF subfamily)
MEDKWLIYRCQRGSEAAFCRLYAKYKEMLFKLAISVVRDVHLAEDIVHDVFAAFAENIRGFRLTGSLKAYLSICVVNRARNVLQERCRRRDGSNAYEHDAADYSGPDHRVLLNEEMQRLSRAMERLPVEQRQVIAMRHFGGMRFGTIAGSLNIPAETAKSRYRYGMDKLRTALYQEEKK